MGLRGHLLRGLTPTPTTCTTCARTTRCRTTWTRVRTRTQGIRIWVTVCGRGIGNGVPDFKGFPRAQKGSSPTSVGDVSPKGSMCSGLPAGTGMHDEAQVILPGLRVVCLFEIGWELPSTSAVGCSPALSRHSSPQADPCWLVAPEQAWIRPASERGASRSGQLDFFARYVWSIVLGLPKESWCPGNQGRWLLHQPGPV